jgi:hypothetical protein
MGNLYRYQKPDGTVLERDLDGNFMRTSLLYSAWLTRGARLSPWSSQVDFGAAVDQGCTVFALSSNIDWSGRVVFDTPRSHDNLKLPFDYARLNKWPEWFVADPATSYQITGLLGEQVTSGGELAEGLPITLAPGQKGSLRVCPA